MSSTERNGRPKNVNASTSPKCRSAQIQTRLSAPSSSTAPRARLTESSGAGRNAAAIRAQRVAVTFHLVPKASDGPRPA